MTEEIQKIKDELTEDLENIFQVGMFKKVLVSLFLVNNKFECHIFFKDSSIKNIKFGNKIRHLDFISEIVFDKIDFKQHSLFFSMLFIMLSKEYNLSDKRDPMNFFITEKNIDFKLSFNYCKCNPEAYFILNFFNFNDKIYFNNCNFADKNVFYGCNFNDYLTFKNCRIKQELVFRRANFKKTPIIHFIDNNWIVFEKVFFDCDFSFSDLDIVNTKKVSFISSIFKNRVTFSGVNRNISALIQYECKLVLIKSVFEASVFFGDIKFKGGNTIASLEFKSDVVFTSQFLDNNNDGRLIFNNFIIHKIYDFNYITDIHKRELDIFETHFKDDVIFPNSKDGYILKRVNILKCIFDGRVDFKACDFKEDVKIMQCIFNKDLSFAKSKFLKHIKFMPIDKHLSRVINIAKIFNIKRKHFDFIENKVKDNIDFSDVSFEVSPNFQSSIFEKLVILYKTKFKEIPNFYSASFSSSAVLDMPLVDIKDYSFNHLKDEIKNKNDLIDIKGVRECLNIFKNALLKANNILEASKYKVLELYAKEVELDYKLEHKKELEEKITIKEQFDRWFLKLNRATSDHHTDFLKILLFTLSVIGGYFMMNLNLGLSSNIYEIKNFNILFFISAVVVLIVSLFLMYKKIIKFDMWFILTFLFIGAISYFFIGFYYEWLLSLGLPIIFIGVLVILLKVFSEKLKISYILFAVFGVVGIVSSPSIITPFLGAFSEDARNHYLYKAIDDLDDKKALELARIILPNDKDLKEFEPSKTILSKNAKLEQISIFDKTDLSVNFIYEQSNQDKNEQSIYKAKKILKDYKDELKPSKLLNESPELKRAVAIDGGVSRLNIAYYLVLAFCIFALQKTMRKNSIIPS